MKAPLHFKNFLKNLFYYENGELVINHQYIEKVNAQNSHKMNEPILCYLNYISVESFICDYDRDIANNDYFDVIYDPPSNLGLTENLNIVASFDQNHSRYYIIHTERLKEYIKLKNIIKNPEKKKKVNKKIEKIDDRITSRFDIMEIE